MKVGEKFLCKSCRKPHNTLDEADRCLDIYIAEEESQLKKKYQNLKFIGRRVKKDSDSDVKLSK
jgi:hypothetical protein